MAGPIAAPATRPLLVRPGLVRAAGIAPIVVFAAVYLSAAGHGFIKDDFVWILNSRIEHASDLVNLFRSDNGFYRPVVALTFSFNEWLFGVNPLGYGLTNVALALLCGMSIAALARAFNLPRGAGVFAAALWLLNLQGIRMAVLWTSGRTALVLTLAATAAATALLRGRLWPAAAWTLVALFSKEEAVLLPAILLAWLFILRAPHPSSRIRIPVWIVVAGVAEGLYFLARSSTAASTVWNAPWYYRPTLEIARVLENVLSYADRVATVPLAITLLAVLMLGRARPLWDRDLRSLLLCSAIWLVGGFGATVFLPVRSDLYACFPSVGVCLGAAAVCARLWQASTDVKRTRALIGALVLLALMTPVYVARTERWSSLAEFSAATLDDLTRLTASLPEGSAVVIHDDRSRRANMSSAFGMLLNEAYLVTTGRRLNLWIEPPTGDEALAGLQAPCATCAALHLRVSNGRLQ